jgi:hypothetical protein
MKIIDGNILREAKSHYHEINVHNYIRLMCKKKTIVTRKETKNLSKKRGKPRFPNDGKESGSEIQVLECHLVRQ